MIKFLSKSIISPLVLCMLCPCVEAVVFEIGFDRTQITVNEIGDKQIIELRGCHLTGMEGHPYLPAQNLNLPGGFGTRATGISILSQQWETLDGNYDIIPAPPVIKASHNGELPEMAVNERIYNTDAFYPQSAVMNTEFGTMRGYSIAGLELFPLRYNPVTGQVQLLRNIVIDVDYREVDTPYQPNECYAELVRGLNRETGTAELCDIRNRIYDTEDVDYLIITTAYLKPYFSRLREWYTGAGWKTEIVTMEHIGSYYAGRVLQMKIKNCIHDYAVNHNTIFVLLAGDDTNVPDQNCYAKVRDVIDNTMPTDLFYACLDERFDWNLDGDEFIGEIEDSIDMYPDVLLSRAPVRTGNQAYAFVNKTLNYITGNHIDSYIDPMLLCGKQLAFTWDGKSDTHHKAEYMWEEYIQGIWPGHNRAQFYDTYTDFGGPAFDVTYENLAGVLNQGYQFFFMSTHGSQTAWSMETGRNFTVNDVSCLSNTINPSIIYTIACLTNAFDSENNLTADPCLSEAFIRNPYGGAVAYIGSSRSGWVSGIPMINHGPSFQYADEFYTFLFSGNVHEQLPAELPYRFGAVSASAKAVKVPQCSHGSGSMRWLNFGLNSMGDPALDIYTEIPLAMEPCYPLIVDMDCGEFAISNVPAGARVCVSKADEIYAGGNCMEGRINFDIEPQTTGSIKLVITAHNYYPFIDSAAVVSEGPYVVYRTHNIFDYYGDGNGNIDPGERVSLGICVENIGFENAEGVYAELVSADSSISIIDSYHWFGTIPKERVPVMEQNAFIFQVPESGSGYFLNFQLSVTDEDSNNWISNFSIPVECPTDVNEKSNPLSFSLYQNYPNPFNVSTIIEYEIPEACPVHLRIYNLAGRIVKEIPETEVEAGKNSYSITAGDLASGVYFYKLTAGEKSFMKRMVLLK
ncbi:MAG: T9SS type A sorting domain-containing protein [candidate division Zixibacteria bacterium]|nr:T9SS type A sorting domain-containing protein [candidate division Zixibacteria bacterium]